MGYPTPNLIPAAITGRMLLIPDDIGIVQAFWGALLPLTFSSSWQPVGAITPTQIASVCQEIVWDALDGVPALTGSVFPIITLVPPSGALLCDGTTYLRTQYPLLYDVLDTHFKIDADHFFVPDLRGRTLVGAGAGSGLTPRAVNDQFGEESHTLVTSEIPSHLHSESGAVPTLINGGLEAPAASATPTATVTGSTGGDGAHNNIQPSIALNYAVWAV
jgi:microcystin-dependent protein